VIDGGIEVELETEQGKQTGWLEKGDGLGFRAGMIRSVTAVDPDADLLLFELR
jgi:hypothetical protein